MSIALSAKPPKTNTKPPKGEGHGSLSGAWRRSLRPPFSSKPVTLVMNQQRAPKSPKKEKAGKATHLEHFLSSDLTTPPSRRCQEQGWNQTPGRCKLDFQPLRGGHRQFRVCTFLIHLSTSVRRAFPKASCAGHREE